MSSSSHASGIARVLELAWQRETEVEAALTAIRLMAEEQGEVNPLSTATNPGRSALSVRAGYCPAGDVRAGRWSCYQPLTAMPRLVLALKAARLQPPQPGIGVRGSP